MKRKRTIFIELTSLLDVILTGGLALGLGFLLRLMIFGRKREEPVLKNQPIVFGKK